MKTYWMLYMYTFTHYVKDVPHFPKQGPVFKKSYNVIAKGWDGTLFVVEKTILYTFNNITKK